MAARDRDYDLYAKVYPRRVPYARDFFAAAAKAAGLSKDGFVLDLACGTGELTVGLSPYCGAALGIDRSKEMLSRRSAVPANVRFVQADLHTANLRLSRPADLVTIGRALHYLRRDTLLPLLGSATKPSSAILICNSQVHSSTAWWRDYWELLNTYVKPLDFADYYGTKFFTGTPWLAAGRPLAHDVTRWNLDEVVAHTLSYPHYAEELKNHEAEFAEKVRVLLTPYCGADDRVEVRIFSDAILYRRN
jgi:SAM-dependent methyltransferase